MLRPRWPRVARRGPRLARAAGRLTHKNSAGGCQVLETTGEGGRVPHGRIDPLRIIPETADDHNPRVQPHTHARRFPRWLPIGRAALVQMLLQFERCQDSPPGMIFLGYGGSTRKPGTCWKSRRFRERSVASCARTMLAIFKSLVPIRIRCLRSRCKMSTASASHGSTFHSAKNAIRRWRRCIGEAPA